MGSAFGVRRTLSLWCIADIARPRDDGRALCAQVMHIKIDFI